MGNINRANRTTGADGQVSKRELLKRGNETQDVDDDDEMANDGEKKRQQPGQSWQL